MAVVKLVKDANYSSLQADATEPQGINASDFLLHPRLSEWAALSSVPFSQLRNGLLLELQACKTSHIFHSLGITSL